jgi:hypothetical protein
VADNLRIKTKTWSMWRTIANLRSLPACKFKIRKGLYRLIKPATQKNRTRRGMTTMKKTLLSIFLPNAYVLSHPLFLEEGRQSMRFSTVTSVTLQFPRFWLPIKTMKRMTVKKFWAKKVAEKLRRVQAVSRLLSSVRSPKRVNTPRKVRLHPKLLPILLQSLPSFLTVR